jgi:hypothetical protein
MVQVFCLFLKAPRRRKNYLKEVKTGEVIEINNIAQMKGFQPKCRKQMKFAIGAK